MSADGKCVGCGLEIESYRNFCSWECHVDSCRREGAVDYRPNGLPVSCITADGTLLECEHGDHETYLFPVRVNGTDHPKDIARGLPPTYPETHALIYTDGSVALTLHECNYYLWSAYDGEPLGGRYQKKHERLSAEALAAIAPVAARQTSERADAMLVVLQRPRKSRPPGLLRVSEDDVTAFDREGSR